MPANQRAGAKTNHALRRAAASLRACEPRFAPLIKRHGPCALQPRRGYFIALCDAILSQQLAVKAAATIRKRFHALFPANRPTPPAVLSMPVPRMRSAGLSARKAEYIQNLAAHFADDRIPTRRFASMDDEAIVAALVPVKGVGVWTAQMFLIFVLNRPDVWPVDDYGVRQGARRLFDLPGLPDAKTLNRLAEPWRPHRTVAAWYLWRSLDNEPLSK